MTSDIASVEEVVCNHTFSDLDTGPGRVCSRCGADDPNVIGQLIALREALLTGAEPVIGAVSALRHAISLLSALEKLEKDALRYRWLKTRINWKEVQGWSTTNRTAPPLTWTQREWTHVDLRPNRPEVEHIDEYLDTAIDLARGADNE